MSLVAVKYLGREDRGSINQIEDWYLPADAVKTQFVDEAGRPLYFVGTPEQIAEEASRLDAPGATAHYIGHNFHYVKKHVAHVVKPVEAPVANTEPVKVEKPAPKKVVPPVVPVANASANVTANT